MLTKHSFGVKSCLDISKDILEKKRKANAALEDMNDDEEGEKIRLKDKSTAGEKEEKDN